MAAGPVAEFCPSCDGTVIPLGRALLRASSDLPGGGDAPSRHVAGEPAFLPIWSCSVWGLPCPLHYCRGGALLPHLFTLTPPVPQAPWPLPLKPAEPAGRYVLCGTFRRSGLNLISRTLSGTLLCGVRTFLPHHLTQRERPSGPAANLVIILDDKAAGRVQIHIWPCALRPGFSVLGPGLSALGFGFGCLDFPPSLLPAWIA